MAETFDKYEKLGAYHWDWYAQNFCGYRDLADLALSFFPESGSVLDVGCGDGLTSFKLFQKGLRVLGIDTNALAIDYAESTCAKQPLSEADAARRQNGGLLFRVESIYDLREEEAFDCMLCHDVIEHVEFPEKLLAAVHRSMRHYAIVSTPNAETNKPKAYDYRLWTPEEFAELLSPYDFSFVHLDKSKIYVKIKKKKPASSA